MSGVCAMASKPHPPLMKKHSQTDLISRLKSRKILGVGGEDDDGEVHRSKVRSLYIFQLFVCSMGSIAENKVNLLTIKLYSTILINVILFCIILQNFPEGINKGLSNQTKQQSYKFTTQLKPCKCMC